MATLLQPESAAIPKTMKAWALFGPNDMRAVEKPVPTPGPGEVLVKVNAIAICGTDLEIIAHGLPAMIEGELPFNGSFVPGHEYVATVASLGEGVDEFAVGDRVTVEIHAGCGRCERCRHGMYTSCLNYSKRAKGHRANGFTTDGAFAEYTVNHINTLVKVPAFMSDEEATLVVTSGTAMYALDVLGGLIAGETIVVTGPGPIGLMGAACAKALGATVILTGTRDNRLALGQQLGADHVVNVRGEDPNEAIKRLTHGEGADLVLECSGAPNAVNEGMMMLKRGGKMCLAAFPKEQVTIDLAYMVRNNIYMYGIRGEGRGAVKRGLALMAQRKFDATPMVSAVFPLAELPEALRTARERIGDAIKVVVKP
jgi:L-iditol 2-dehydrogenase